MGAIAEALSFRENASRHNPIHALTGIFEPHCQIAVAERQPVASIVQYVASAAEHMGAGFRVSLNDGERLPLHLLPALPGREDFAADINFLVEMYGVLLGCPAVGLRLEVLGRAMCPRFHVDQTGIRLLCTYQGPGTEWLEDGAADRSKLGPVSAGIGDERSGIIRDPSGIHRIPPFAVALLKGSGWQGNSGRGIIHRSPQVPQSGVPRVLLAMDAIW